MRGTRGAGAPGRPRSRQQPAGVPAQKPRRRNFEDSEDAEDENAEDLDEPGSLARTVVLVNVGDDGERLLVIPLDVACSELRTYATLQHAGTYRDVLADDGAVGSELSLSRLPRQGQPLVDLG